MGKIKIKEVIVTEGKYDRIKLENIFDTVIITTDGFDIYKNKKKLELIRRLAQNNGVVVMTDSDAAGFKIRNHLIQCFGDISVKNVYIPEIKGKERRKQKASKEGLLGVEGIDDSIIIDAVMKQTRPCNKSSDAITKTDFYNYGLTGHNNSTDMRAIISKSLDLPVKISANKLLEVVNALYSKDEFEQFILKINDE